MPRRKGVTSSKVLERRAKVAGLMAQGKRSHEIAELLALDGNTGRTTVRQDAKVIRKKWKEIVASQSLEELRGREKAVLEHIRAEAFDAWQRSKGPAETLTTVTRQVRAKEQVNDLEAVPADAEEVSTTHKVAGQVGTPAFLNLALVATQEIEDLMGLKAKPGAGEAAPPLLGIRLFAPNTGGTGQPEPKAV